MHILAVEPMPIKDHITNADSGGKYTAATPAYHFLKVLSAVGGRCELAGGSKVSFCSATLLHGTY